MEKLPYSVYFAAALFNGRECYFNVNLARLLEDRFRQVYLPQRDGFEFSKLAHALERFFPQHEAGEAVKHVIYAYDIGKQLHKSEVVVANFDEPLDPGVDIELAYAAMMFKYVVGFRTDVRACYGTLTDSARGAHFFPVNQCRVFIHHDMTCRTCEEANSGLEALANKIAENSRLKPVEAYAELHPTIQRVVDAADLLFKDIADVNHPESMKIIARRYQEHRERMLELSPRTIRH
ncbi:hypothetical protein FJZ19_03295 [Candidatus Pacearchaeota archaeon]|nr:hypothetical protein [Candidatus Pacearchaeota archaeon]